MEWTLHGLEWHGLEWSLVATLGPLIIGVLLILWVISKG
jgi:hypothetical protein